MKQSNKGNTGKKHRHCDRVKCKGQASNQIPQEQTHFHSKEGKAKPYLETHNAPLRFPEVFFRVSLCFSVYSLSLLAISLLSMVLKLQHQPYPS